MNLKDFLVRKLLLPAVSKRRSIREMVAGAEVCDKQPSAPGGFDWDKRKTLKLRM